MAEEKDTEAPATKQDSKKAEKKEVKYVCKLNIADLIGSLHKVAVEAAGKTDKNYTVSDTAFDDDGKLVTAGKHLIVAFPNKGAPEKEEAKKVLQAYAQAYSGPDVVLKDDEIYELRNEDEKDSKEQKEFKEYQKQKKVDQAKGKDSAKTVKERKTVSTFLQYIAEANEDKAKDSENEEDAEDKTNDNALGAVKGYYITYNLEIEGVKESTMADALKKFAKNFFDDLGISNYDWMAGSSGERHTIGGLKDELNSVFGDLDSDQIQSAVKEELGKRYPQSNPAINVFDVNTIKQHLKSKLESDDYTKLKKAKFSLCIKVGHDTLGNDSKSGKPRQKSNNDGDKSQMLYNKQEIANVINNAITGLWKKFKNKIDASSIIFINDYDGSGRADDEKQIKATAQESLLKRCFAEMLVERMQKIVSQRNSKNKIMSLLFEDYVAEEDSNASKSLDDFISNSKDKFKSIVDKNLAAIKTEHHSFVENGQNLSQEAREYLNGKENDFKDYNLNYIVVFKQSKKDSNEIIAPKGYSEGALDYIENGGDAIEYKDEEPEQLGTGESYVLSSAYGKLIQEASSGYEQTIQKIFKEIEEDTETKNVLDKSSGDSPDKFYKFTIHQDVLNESQLLLEGHEPYLLSCINEINRVGKKNIVDNVSTFRAAWKKYYGEMIGKKDKNGKKNIALPDDLEKRKENRETYIDYLKNHAYADNVDRSPFDKGITSKLGKAETLEQIKNIFRAYPNDTAKVPTDKETDLGMKSKQQEVPELYAAWKALKELPDKNKTITVTFYDSTKDDNYEGKNDIGEEIKKLENLEAPIKIDLEEYGIKPPEHEGYKFKEWLSYDGKHSIDDELKENAEFIAGYEQDNKEEEKKEEDKEEKKEEDKNTHIEFYDIDPENPDDDSKWKKIGDTVDAEKAEDVEYPKLNSIEKHDGYKLLGWSIEKDKLGELLEPGKTVKITTKYRSKQARVSFYDIDPEDKDNAKKYKRIGKTYIISKDDIDNLDSKTFEVVKTAKDVKYPDVKEIQKNHKQNQFSKWTIDEDKLHNAEKLTGEIKIYATYMNKKPGIIVCAMRKKVDERQFEEDNDNSNIKKNVGKYDLYIVPMPGLTTTKYQSHKSGGK